MNSFSYWLDKTCIYEMNLINSPFIDRHRPIVPALKWYKVPSFDHIRLCKVSELDVFITKVKVAHRFLLLDCFVLVTICFLPLGCHPMPLFFFSHIIYDRCSSLMFGCRCKLLFLNFWTQLVICLTLSVFINKLVFWLGQNFNNHVMVHYNILRA